MKGGTVALLAVGALLALSRAAGADPGDAFGTLGLVRLDAGIRVPEFTLPDLRGGSVTVSRSGPATVLVFFATW